MTHFFTSCYVSATLHNNAYRCHSFINPKKYVAFISMGTPQFTQSQTLRLFPIFPHLWKCFYNSDS